MSGRHEVEAKFTVNWFSTAMLLCWTPQILVAALVIVYPMLSPVIVVEASHYALDLSWSVKNNDALSVVKGTTGEKLRIIFMDNESSTYALAFFDLNGTSLSSDSFLLAIVTMPQSNIANLWNVMWSANRDRPVGENATLGFKFDGNMALWDRDGVEVWSTQLMAGVRIEGLIMDKSGNLLLLDATYASVWESFKHPTDTILPGQVLQVGAVLLANSSSSDPSLPSYQLTVEHGGLALYASSSSSSNLLQKPEPYWISSLSIVRDLDSVLSSCEHPAMVLLDSTQGLVVTYDLSETSPSVSNASLCSQSHFEASVALSNYGLSVSHQFVRLDRDGNIRLYAYTLNSGTWQVVASVLNSVCDIPGACGKYGVCFEGQCSCANSSTSEPLKLVDSTAVAPLSCNNPPGTAAAGQISNCSAPAPGYHDEIFIVDSVDYFSNKYFSPDYVTSNNDDCGQHCLENCSCSASFYHNDTGACFLVANVHSLQGVSQIGYSALLKVTGSGAEPTSLPPSPGGDRQGISTGRKRSSGLVPIVVSVGLGSIGLLLLLAFVLWTLYRLFGKKGRVQIQKLYEEPGEDAEFLDSIPGLPPRYTLKDLSMATNGFQTRIGNGGGFGSVYEGALADGSRVAVKRLEAASRQWGEKEFRAQVAAIGSIQHINLLRLRGFCTEGVHRLLVYEHMPKGSLDKWLFAPKEGAAEEFKTDGFVLDWNTRIKIALGTARGLAFLHEECSGKMIHKDFKPQNILLDEQFFPKVSDFGLVKVIMDSTENNNQQGVKGTPGYLAPELLLGSHVSEKIDIYSYGIVLIELLTGRKSIDLFMEFESDYFPSWAMNMARDGRLRDSLDKRLGVMVPEVQCQRVIQIAYWCVHRDFKKRPSMKMVVQMLEGLAPVPEMPVAELADLSSFKVEHFHEKTRKVFLSTSGSIPDELSGPE